MSYANSADPDHEGAVWSGSVQFAISAKYIKKQLYKMQPLGKKHKEYSVWNFKTFIVCCNLNKICFSTYWYCLNQSVLMSTQLCKKNEILQAKFRSFIASNSNKYRVDTRCPFVHSPHIRCHVRAVSWFCFFFVISIFTVCNDNFSCVYYQRCFIVLPKIIALDKALF